MQKAMNKKQEMIQDISIFSGSMYFAQLVYFLRGFLNARIVGPNMYGLWAALNIILSFGFYVTLGALNGMSREIPYSMGKGATGTADRIRASAFGFTLVSSIIVSIFVMMIASLFFKESLGRAGMMGMLTVSILIVIQNIVTFYEMALSAVKRFSVMAIADLIFPTLCVIFTLILVTRWNIYGIYTVALLWSLGLALFFYFMTGYRPNMRFDIKEIFRLIRIGSPLMSLLLFPLILFAIDRILIFRFLGATELGYYALGLLVCNALIYLPGAIGMVMQPRIMHRYGETGRIEDLKKYLFVPTMAMAVLLPISVGIVYFISSFVIRHLMTQYIPSLTPLFIVLFGKFFLLFSPTIASFLTAINKQYRMVFFYLIAILLSAILDIVVLRLGYGLTGVALATALVSLLLGTALFLYTASFYLKKRLDCIVSCTKLYFPYIYILGFTIVLNLVFKSKQAFSLDLLLVFLKIIILLLLSIPFIIHLDRQIRFFEEALHILKSRLRIPPFHRYKVAAFLAREES